MATSNKLKKEENSIYNEEYYKRALPDFGSFQKRSMYFDPIVSLLARKEIKRALDIGCADGALVYSLFKKGVDAYGVDISSYAINTSLLRERLFLVDVNNESLPFPDSYFDLVTAIDTLEHLNRPENAISKIARVLKVSGFFFMITPSPCVHPFFQKIYRLLACPYPRDPTHVSELPQHIWLTMLHRNGLKPIQIPRFKLFKLKLYKETHNAIIDPYEIGPISTKCGLNKLGFFRKVAQFMYGLLLPSPQKKIIILTIKSNSSDCASTRA